ncbi:MAG: T9SS type A sorting domain-containing protein [Bacteroidales bacterium]|nr:T9SS type A sorting domain-containing protein [Bacteroidales bacterium]
MKKVLIVIVFILFSTGEFTSLYSQCSHVGKKLYGESVSPSFSSLQYKYDVTYYHINIETGNTNTYINAYTEIVFTALESMDTIVFELSDDLDLVSVTLNSSEHNNYQHFNNLIFVIPDKAIQKGEVSRLGINYAGTSQSSSFFSGISNKSDNLYGQRVTYTLSEPYQSLSWFPVKQDLMDKADSVRVYITVNDGLMAGSNGVLEEIDHTIAGKKTFKWFSKYPIAYYLISFSVSNYLDYSFNVKIPGVEDSLLVQNYIYNTDDILMKEKENIDKTGPLLELYSGLFGIYPFINEKYGHCMAPLGGGMEHQTMTTLQNFNFLLVAHELAHQWFGDYVTCSSWQDIWINEGFASYCEYLALEFLEGQPKAIEWMDDAHSIALNAKTGSVYLPIEETGDPGRIFDYRLSYKKGASILNMLRYELDNDEFFFKILREFLQRFKNSVASGQDFLEICNEISGGNYNWFFNQWYYGEGYPVFQVSYRSVEDTLYIESRQTGSGETDFFKTHFDVKIYFENGQDTIVRLEQDEALNTFNLPVKMKVSSIQMDPYSRLLMKSFVFEYFPETGIIEVGPNPFYDNLHVLFSNANSEKEIWITDLTGQVFYHKVINPSSSIVLELDYLPDGIYILTSIEDSQRVVKKILKL